MIWSHFKENLHLIWNVTDDAQVNGLPSSSSCHKSVVASPPCFVTTFHKHNLTIALVFVFVFILVFLFVFHLYLSFTPCWYQLSEVSCRVAPCFVTTFHKHKSPLRSQWRPPTVLMVQFYQQAKPSKMKVQIYVSIQRSGFTLAVHTHSRAYIYFSQAQVTP